MDCSFRIIFPERRGATPRSHSEPTISHRTPSGSNYVLPGDITARADFPAKYDKMGTHGDGDRRKISAANGAARHVFRFFLGIRLDIDRCLVYVWYHKAINRTADEDPERWYPVPGGSLLLFDK